MSFIKSDCGRAQAGLGESSDCTVRALAAVAEVDYMRAHEVLANHGRKKGRGVHLRKVIQSCAHSLGIELRQVRRSGSLDKLLRDFPYGSLVVRVREHAFAVRDGAVIDISEQSPARHIKGAWLRIQ